MTKPKLGLISLMLIGGAAVPWLIQRHSDIKTINSLQIQLDELTQQRTGEESSTNQIAQAVSPLPNDQSSELLRLRNEVTLLRRETNELFKSRAENGPLRSDPSAGKSQGQPNLAAGDSVPVESLTFAGYATPEAAFQSTLSADAKSDFKTFFEGFTPERRLEEEKGITGKSESELAARAAERAAHFATANVRILNSRPLSEDEAELLILLATEKQNELVTMSMRRIAGEWKISSERH
jgi:hypothetical protein